MSYRLSVDVGGTFTDIVLFDDKNKTVHTTKTHSTPKDYSLGIQNGIKKICDQVGIDIGEIVYFIHGTTVATNALLERKGAKTALITTEGFRDVLEVARQRRPDLYNFWVKRPESPIPRYLVFEVPERALVDGTVAQPLDQAAALQVIQKLKELEVESVAVCFLHSYKNPANEAAMKELILREMPGIHLCTSSETLPEIREYERFCTTAVNAYLMPKVKDYINHLDETRKDMGLNAEVHIMQSNGGIMSAQAAGDRSVHTVFSGPAGGVLASIYMSKLLNEKNIVTIDIGGTSSDLALIQDHEIAFTSNAELGGFPVKVPMVEMHTIGAGGGSIAWVDAGGGIRVGPQSAGAYPGPACYGYGDNPTVTDSNVVLGYLNPANFLGGEFTLSKEKSENAINEKVAKVAGLEMLDAAIGIRRLVNANMCGGINVVSTQKGYDLRDFSLMAFGGGGSLHAVALADELNIKKVIVPTNPGMFSAIGCQLAKVRYDYVRTLVKPVSTITVEEYNASIDEMKAEAIRDLAKEGFAEKDLFFTARSDMRYSGQAWELATPVAFHAESLQDFADCAKAFEEIHTRTYGYTLDDDIVFVNLRFSAFGVVPALEFPAAEVLTSELPANAIKGSRSMFFDGKFMESTIYQRENMLPGNAIQGPAMIEEYAASTPIPPHHTAKIDEFRNIIITRNA